MNTLKVSEPQASRPHMPGYGLLDADAGSGLMDWHRASQQMAAARNYWLNTTRPDGRPHAAPIWGVWLDETLLFGLGVNSRKARNLAKNRAVSLHLESGDDVLILEGVVEPVSAPAVLARYVDAYGAKYDFRPDPADPETVTYALRIETAFAWLERDFPATATRWRFGDRR